MGGDADAVVPDSELYLFSQGPCRDEDDRAFSTVTGGVLQQLPQYEGCPLSVGIDAAIQPFGFQPDIILNEEGTVVLHCLSHDFIQPCLADDTVPFRAFRPCIEQGALHMSLHLSQFKGKPAAGVSLQIPADKPGGGDGSFDFMDPALHIFPVFPLGCPGVGHLAHHVPPRPAGQVKQTSLIRVSGRRHTFGEQIRLIQPRHNGLQLPKSGPLAEKADNQYCPQDSQHHSQQNDDNTWLSPGSQKEKCRQCGTGQLKYDLPQSVGKKLTQAHS